MRIKYSVFWLHFLIAGVLCLNLGPAHAQGSRSVKYVQQVEPEFKSVLSKYVARDYRAAFAGLESLSNSQVVHHRMTATLLLTGKSLYHLGHYSAAIPYFDKVIHTFPQSKYVDDAHYARAATLYRLEQNKRAVQDLLWVVDRSTDKRLVAKSMSLATYLLRSELSFSDLRELSQAPTGEIAGGLTTVAYARKELMLRSSEDALKVLDRYRRRYKNNQFAAQIDQLIKEARGAGSRPVKIGVVLPLSGYFGEEGLGVLRGIKFAHSQDARNSPHPIELVVRDSESNMIKAIHNVKNLINRENVRAIIGDLESEITAGIGAIAADKAVPVVAPAATENGVASVGETVFQLNSDLERKGRALAQYAMNELGMQTFATLAPADDYGQQMVASFTATVDELGGRIIAQSWYYDTPEDLSRQFKNIREAAFHHDSTDVEALIRAAQQRGEKLKEKDIPVLSIEGFFIPVYAEDIKYVAPQLALHNIRTQILGGEYLDNLEILKGGQIERYIDGAIFVSDFFPDEENGEFRRFRTDFRLQMKKTPERWEVFGYDAYRIISDAVAAGSRTGQEISNRLSQLDGYQGKKGKISFLGNNRVNKEVNYLQFINGRIVKHQ